MDMSLSKLWEIVKDREAWCATNSARGHKKSDTTEKLNNDRRGNGGIEELGELPVTPGLMPPEEPGSPEDPTVE